MKHQDVTEYQARAKALDLMKKVEKKSDKIVSSEKFLKTMRKM